MVMLQGVNYILPLITIPYITRVITPESFGLISYAQAFIGYFTIIINYGFDFTATRQIASNRDNPNLISKVFNETIQAKVLLFLGTSLVFFPIVLFVPKINQNADIFYISYLINIGFVFMPTWFFQGIEKLNYIAVFNFIIKLIFTVLVFLFVKEAQDYLFIPISTVVGQVVAGTISYIWALSVFKIKPFWGSLKPIIQALVKGFPVFASTIAVNLYTTTNLIVLGSLGTSAMVGYYSASSKLILIFVSAIMLPVGLTLFPFIGKKLASSVENGLVAIRKAAYLVGGATLILSLGIFFFSHTIVETIYGPSFKEAEASLKTLAFLPFIIGLNNIFGTQGLLNLKMDKAFLVVTTIGAVGSILLNFLLIPKMAEQGTAVAWLLTEIFITVSFFIILLKKGFRL